MNSLTTSGNNVPYELYEFPIRATPLCGAFGAGYRNTALAGGLLQGSQTAAFTITQTQTINNVPCTVVATYATIAFYGTTTCTGIPEIRTFLSSSTTTVVATGATPAGVLNVVAGSNVNTGAWVAASTYVTGLPATTPYTIQNYYASQAGCTSSQASALVRSTYQFPAFGCVSCLSIAMPLPISPRADSPVVFWTAPCRYNGYAQCAAPNPAATYETAFGVPQPYANPQLSYGVACGQVSSTNSFAQINLYTVS
jgi:hypothetical protein